MNLESVTWNLFTTFIAILILSPLTRKNIWQNSKITTIKHQNEKAKQLNSLQKAANHLRKIANFWKSFVFFELFMSIPQACFPSTNWTNPTTMDESPRNFSRKFRIHFNFTDLEFASNRYNSKILNF